MGSFFLGTCSRLRRSNSKFELNKKEVMSVPKPKIRDWHVSQVLSSVSRLNEVLPELTEDEVLAALDLESQSRRRRSITNRLISRAVRMNELAYSNKLKEQYHGTYPKQNPVGL